MTRLASRSESNGLRLAFPGAGTVIPPEEIDGSKERKRIFCKWNCIFRIPRKFAFAIGRFRNLQIRLRA